MKVTKGFILFGVSTLITACFDPPQYSVVPVIEYVGISFKEGTQAEPTDALTVTISFKDGDGDLGLSPTQIDDPYHDVYLGLANAENIIDVSKETRSPNLPQFLKIPPGATGKLVTIRTLDDPYYAGKLPPYIDEFSSCTDYKLQTVYISEEDSHIIDESYLDIDILEEPGSPKVFVVQDIFYKKKNPKHDNIEVEFWIKGPGGDYALFDWEKEYCESAFNQRFPMLSDKTGPLEGNLSYALTSLGIRATLGTQMVKLRIRIRDRAFNVSNEIETEEFTLDKIKG